MNYSKRHTSKFYVGLGIFLLGIATFYMAMAIVSYTEFRMSNQLTTLFGSGILANRTELNFQYGGNAKVGFYLPRSLEILTTPEIVSVNGMYTGYCSAKVRGLYYNNQRGERIWPLDSNTLTELRTIDSSYDNLTLIGGLFTLCSGSSYAYSGVYGQVTMQYQNTPYYLIAGLSTNTTSNTHGDTISSSLAWKNNSFSGFIWDSYGGVGVFIPLPTCEDNRSPSQSDICVGVNFTQTSICGGTRISSGTKICITGTVISLNPGANSGIQIATGAIQISGFTATGIVFTNTGLLHLISSGTSSGSLIVPLSGVSILSASGRWDGVLSPPILLSNGDENNATFGDTGLPDSVQGNTIRTIISTIKAGSDTDGLTISGGYFVINFVLSGGISGKKLDIYRSNDGSTWSANSPDTYCKLDANKVCSFRTDHLSYFATVKAATLCTSTHLLCIDGKYETKPGVSCEGGKLGNSCSITGTDISIEDLLTALIHSIKGSGSIVDSPFTTERNNAYLYAYQIGITTMPTIKQANMNGDLIRSHMAKMMVNYVVNVLKKSPNTSLTCNFSDISSESEELQGYIKQACQLGIMGQGMNQFYPNGKVTRAEFGTVLSRALYGNTYNTGTPYYVNHLKILKNNAIISNTNPTMREIRAYVMLMLMRASTL